MATLGKGTLVTAKEKVLTGQAPGGDPYGTAGLGPNSKAYIKDSRTVNGKLYYDLDFTEFGGGTGWALADSIIPYQAKPQSSQPGGSTQQPTLQNGLVTTPASAKPTAQNQLQGYLDTLNQTLKDVKDNQNSFTSGKTDEEILSNIKQNVIPQEAVPQAPNLVNLFTELRSDQGIQDLETKMTDLKAAEENVQAELRQYVDQEESKPVATNVIAGRVSEAVKQKQEELDFIQRQINRVNGELTTRYNLVSTIISLTSTDFQNAMATYETKFNQNMQIYNAFRSEKQYEEEKVTRKVERAEDKAFDLAVQLADWEREDNRRAEDAARSNLQIYTNLISEGGIDYASLTKDQKLAINKLEVQAGLPVGLVSQIQSPGDEVKSITTRQDASGMKYADIIYQGTDGSIRVESKRLGFERLPSGSGGNDPSDSDIRQADISNLQYALERVSGDDGHTSEEDYLKAQSDWVKAGYTSSDFDKIFARTFVNPQYYGSYGLTDDEAVKYGVIPKPL